MVIPTILFVTSTIFVLIQLIPGDVITNMLVDFQYRYSERDMESLKASLGIDVPIYIQYFRWTGDLLQGDLGRSLYTNRSVTDDVLAKLPISLELGVIAIISALLIALPIGVYSAIRQDTYGDYLARSFAIICISIPSFWMATLVIVLPSIWFGWTPELEYIPFREDPLKNLLQFLIPGVIMGMVLSGTTMRMTRTMMLEVLRQDYVRTAWSKGLNEKVVVIRHCIRNAAIPVITLIGLMLPVLVGGSVILEEIFGLPGIGRYMLESIGRRDYIVLSGCTLTLASGVIIANLITDLSYLWLDPRVRIQ
jgi:peptide/nickel transport system permease protein